MSTLQLEKCNNITCISGELTFDFKEMMNELGDNPHCLFGDINKLLGGSDVEEMNIENRLDLLTNGTTSAYYQHNNVYCYLCVRESDLKNYMFSPDDSENRENEYNRLRRGVESFAKEGFKIYIMH